MAALRRPAPPTALPVPLRTLAARLAPPLQLLLASALEAALPQRCPGCGEPCAPEAFVCARCANGRPRFARAVCARCLVEGRAPDACRQHAAHRVHAAFLYDGVLAAWVQAFKFGARPGLARAAGAELAASLPGRWRHAALVTSVPLHAARRRERGYDQAGLLAEAVARAIGVPCVPGLLERTRATRAQTALGARERRDNVRGAFVLSQPGWVRGRRVLLVDDVLTTGATLDECLAVLAAAGARPRAAVLAWAQ